MTQKCYETVCVSALAPIAEAQPVCAAPAPAPAPCVCAAPKPACHMPRPCAMPRPVCEDHCRHAYRD